MDARTLHLLTAPPFALLVSLATPNSVAFFIQSIRDQLCVVHYPVDGVVNLVRHPPRQCADGLEFLTLYQLSAHGFPLLLSLFTGLLLPVSLQSRIEDLLAPPLDPVDTAFGNAASPYRPPGAAYSASATSDSDSDATGYSGSTCTTKKGIL